MLIDGNGMDTDILNAKRKKEVIWILRCVEIVISNILRTEKSCQIGVTKPTVVSNNSLRPTSYMANTLSNNHEG